MTNLRATTSAFGDYQAWGNELSAWYTIDSRVHKLTCDDNAPDWAKALRDYLPVAPMSFVDRWTQLYQYLPSDALEFVNAAFNSIVPKSEEAQPEVGEAEPAGG